MKIAGRKWDKKSVTKWAIALAVISLCNAALTSAVLEDRKYPDGYYVHNDQVYYRYHHDWYTPDDTGDDWVSVSDYSVYGDIEDTDFLTGYSVSDIEDENYGYLDDWDVVSFTDSSLYAGLTSSSDYSDSSYRDYDDDDGWSSSWDDDDDWDSGYDDWDSGSTDWDSDW